MSKNKPMTFSYSKMATYAECPYKYKCKYIDKIPQQPKYYFSFGTAIHAALEFMHAQSKMPSLAEIINYFAGIWNAKDWRDAGFPSSAKYAAFRYDGIAILTKYYSKYASNPACITEYKTDVLIDNLLVRIIADKIQHKSGGHICIIDYKTGKNVMRNPEQLMMYQKITECDPALLARVRSIYGKKIKKIIVDETIYLHVPSLEEHVFPRATISEIKAFWDSALSIANNIREAKFTPTPCDRACKWCDYKTRCPAIGNTGPDL